MTLRLYGPKSKVLTCLRHLLTPLSFYLQAAMGGGQPVGFAVGLALGGILTETIGEPCLPRTESRF